MSEYDRETSRMMGPWPTGEGGLLRLGGGENNMFTNASVNSLLIIGMIFVALLVHDEHLVGC